MNFTDESEWKTVKSKRKYPGHFPTLKKKKIVNNEVTADELIKFKDIDSHTNLIKMQIDELLKEIKQNDGAINLWLDAFKECVREIPESSSEMINEFPISKGIMIPISLLPKNEKGCFKFMPPSKIVEIGSYFLDTISSSTPVIDIAIEIRKICWQGMDHLNYRYHRKRALYLTYLAQSLLESDLIDDMEFSYQNDCNIKPVLLIKPKGIEGFSFCVTAFPPEEAFNKSRFYPDKKNIRAAWFYNNLIAVDEPSSLYNNVVLIDLIVLKLNEYLKEKLSSPCLKEAVILLKIWATQRGLTRGYGRINGFILTAFIVSLLDKKRISIHMNSYEIFKIAILELSVDLLGGDFFNEIIKFDALYSVTNETKLMIQHEAKLALKVLDGLVGDKFNYLFIKKIAFMEKFEYLLHLENVKVDIIQNICEKLRKGLGKRILLLDVMKHSTISWPITSPIPTSDNNITIGFLLNPDVPMNNLEKGPCANDPEAKSFRKFWGSKSELRRFQDGSVREAVFWPASTVADKREVFCSILKDIMEKHFKIEKHDVTVNGVETDNVLHIPDIIFSKNFSPYGTGEEAHIKLMQSFDSLCKQLRTLDLPLQIASIQGTSSAFRFMEVFPPLSVLHQVDPSKCFVDGPVMKLKNRGYGVPPYLPALKAIVCFEGSGKWPDDVEALRHVKVAFQIKIADLVKSKLSLTAVPFLTHTDICKDGYIFRFEVACHKEIFLLKQIKAPDGSIKAKETKEALDLQISTQILPKLNSILHGLHQQHNSYGTACRLSKRWVASHLKNGFIHDITIELLVAFIYIHPEPYTCPCSPQVAFIRFLSLLTTHNWAASPLIVNLNNEFKIEDIEEINTMFTSQRSTLPAMVIATPFDKRGNMWTKSMPPELILKRMIILAEASLDALNTLFINNHFIDIKDIFRPLLASFDLIIHLKRKEIPKIICSIDVRIDDFFPLYSPYEYKAHELYPIVDFDPVQKYLEELRVNFGDFAVFLNDPYGGDLIAVKWKSASFKPENAKIHHGCKIIPNVDEIIESFQILGEGLIRNIEYKTQNWQLP